MLAVTYDHEMLAHVDGVLERSAEILRGAAKMMSEHQGLTDAQFASLEITQHELGAWLGRFDRGYWVPSEALSTMREHEAHATDILEDPDLQRIFFVEDEVA